MSRIQFLRSVQHSDALVAYLKGWAPTLPLITSIQTYDGDGYVSFPLPLFPFPSLPRRKEDPPTPLPSQTPNANLSRRTGQFPFLNLAETIKQNTDPNIDVLKIVEGFDGMDGSGAGGLEMLGALWAGVNVTYC